MIYSAQTPRGKRYGVQHVDERGLIVSDTGPKFSAYEHAYARQAGVRGPRITPLRNGKLSRRALRLGDSA